jgi:hypothetical protein
MTNKEKELDICSYWTFKVKEKPVIYEVRDGGGKGWCNDTVNPTVHMAGWKDCIQEFNYGLFHHEKPKAMAIRLLKERWGERWMEGKKFLYYPYYYTGRNNYMDALYVYYKEK